ncbi:MAG: tetratricopeptide repeat protein, partial [Desulfobacterales bacterium]
MRVRSKNSPNPENGFHLKPPSILRNRRHFVVFAVLMAVCLGIIYGNSFDSEWHLDDRLITVRNKNLQLDSLSWQAIRQTFYAPRGQDQNTGKSPQRFVRPVVSLTLALNYYFGQTNVIGYHIVNLLIHYITAIFLFLFIVQTLNLPSLKTRYAETSYAIALLAVFFWATSPVQVSAVTYIVQRMSSMAGMGYIMAMYFYVKGRISTAKGKPWIFFVCAVLSWLMALGSKENAAMLPVSLILYELLFLQERGRNVFQKPSQMLLIVFPVMVVMGFVYGAFSIGVAMLTDYGPYSFSLTERLLTSPRIFLFYISILLYPIESRMTLLYDIAVSKSLFEPLNSLLPIMGIAVFIAMAIWLIRRKRYLFVYCMFFFFLNHLIEGTVIPLHLAFLHRNYIPSMLFFVPPAVLMVHVLGYFSYHRGIQWVMAVGIGLILAAQGSVTFSFNRIWKTEQTLWQDNIDKFPNLSLPHHNLGSALYSARNFAQAQVKFQRALDLNRDQVPSHFNLYRLNLAKTLIIQNRKIDTAISYLDRLIRGWPLKADVHDTMGMAQMRKGDYEAAAAFFQKAIQLSPKTGAYHLNFALGL